MGAARHVVLGGCGFIGRHVALALLRRGERVVLAGRAPPTEAPPDIDPALVSFAPFDLGTADWGTLLRDGDVVHHYAWSTIPKTANENPLADLDVNLRGTLRLLEALRRRHGARLVFSSSGGTVYGPLHRTPVAEDHPLDPVTAYGVSKLAAEKYLGFFRAIHGLDCRIARISNPYGIGQDPRRKQGAASIFLQRALADEPIEVWGDGGVVRDYIHVADVADGLLALADAAPERLPPLPVFNIGSGEGVSITEMLDAAPAAPGTRTGGAAFSGTAVRRADQRAGRFSRARRLGMAAADRLRRRHRARAVRPPARLAGVLQPGRSGVSVTPGNLPSRPPSARR